MFFLPSWTSARKFLTQIGPGTDFLAPVRLRTRGDQSNFSLSERLDLLELIDDRHGRRSTLVTSQLPIAHWHAYLGEDPTVADALLDRLLSAAHRLELKGESLRKRQKQNGKELDPELAKR